MKKNTIITKPPCCRYTANYEGHSKDYEFSRASMQGHWRAGYHDAVRTLRHPEVLQRPNNRQGLLTFDADVRQVIPSRSTVNHI